MRKPSSWRLLKLKSNAARLMMRHAFDRLRPWSFARRRLEPVAAILLLAACSSSAPSPKPLSQSAIQHEILRNASNYNKSHPLPLDYYLVSEPEREQLSYARNILAYRCVREYGFEIRRPRRITSTAVSTLISSRRYGVTDVLSAAEFGYGFPTIPSGKARTIKSLTEFGALKGPLAVVMYGPGRGASTENIVNDAGKPIVIHTGGCSEVGLSKIASAGDDDFASAPTAERLNVESFRRSAQAPSVRAANRKWVSCMSSLGRSYQDPDQAVNDPKWKSPEYGRLEVNTALQDAQCKRRTMIVDIRYRSEREIETELIDARQVDLDVEHTGLRRQVEFARRIIKSF